MEERLQYFFAPGKEVGAPRCERSQNPKWHHFASARHSLRVLLCCGEDVKLGRQMTQQGSIRIVPRRLAVAWRTFPYLREGGKRDGLVGGNRGDGGAANVDNNWRDNRSDDIAVRLVLARNNEEYMPEREGTQLREILMAGRPAQENEPAPPFDARELLRTKEQLEVYAAWKREVPASVRALVEGSMLGREVLADRDALPLVRESYETMKLLLEDPSRAIDELQADSRVKNMLGQLAKLPTGREKEYVNLYAILADSSVGFDIKLAYTRDKLLPRLHWLAARAKEERDRGAEQETVIDILPDEENDNYTVHRSVEQEQVEGMPDHVAAMTYPYFGGYYAGIAHDVYDPHAFTWSRSARQYRKLPEQLVEEETRRVYRGTVRSGRSVAIRRSDNWQRPWSVDTASIRWLGDAPASFQFARDQDAMIVLSTEGDAGKAYQFEVNIGPCSDAIVPDAPDGSPSAVDESFHGDLVDTANAIMREDIPAAAKIRRIASVIRGHLEYSVDSSLEAVYKADPARYFEIIWEKRQAKCDEANTLAARLLQRCGFHVRFVGEHSARTQSDEGWTLLHDGNLHGWFWAWDPEEREWLRRDATPKGDPNVDEEEQDAELGEGDFGAQEAELMTEEELQKALDKILKEERDAERELPEVSFARDAGLGCTPEEARRVLEKIRVLRERNARVLKDADKQWQTLVRRNMSDRIVDRGPVPLSQADDIDEDEMVAGYIELQSGEKDPHIGAKEHPKQKTEEWFGGYEVYIAADLSGSMNDEMNGVKKALIQRDMVFLMIDSCMNAAAVARKKNRQLKSPMPVKVCVTVFGQRTEISLPLTDAWGPAEQLKLYRALDAGAGGGTPDHDALGMIERQVEAARVDEEAILQKMSQRKRADMKKHGWRMRRFVVVVADGGSNEPDAVKTMNDRFAKEGVPVDLFLVAPTEDANLYQAASAVYQQVTQVPDPTDLAEKGLRRLTDRIREAYE